MLNPKQRPASLPVTGHSTSLMSQKAQGSGHICSSLGVKSQIVGFSSLPICNQKIRKTEEEAGEEAAGGGGGGGGGEAG